MSRGCGPCHVTLRGLNPVKRRALTNIKSNTGGLELYFVDKVGSVAVADHNQYGITLSTNATFKTLAHEIGHAFGCADVYPVQKLNHNVHIPDNNVAEWKESMDWSNGTGCRYYETGVRQEEIILLTDVHIRSIPPTATASKGVTILPLCVRLI